MNKQRWRIALVSASLVATVVAAGLVACGTSRDPVNTAGAASSATISPGASASDRVSNGPDPTGSVGVPATAATGACSPLPIATSAASQQHTTKKKVFAYYFPPFPVSIENKPPTGDYYSSWKYSLNAINGAYDLRDRPLPRNPVAGAGWKQTDFATEVRRAREVGIDGFIWEYNPTSGDARWQQLPAMLAAAKAVDPAFRIMLSPDIPNDATAGPDAMATNVAKLKNEAALYRTEDGRVVLAPFYPERRAVSWWDSLHDKLAAQGVNSALVPIFLSWAGGSDKSEWTGHVYGYSTWGTRTASGTATYVKDSQAAHARGGIWMQAAAFEDSRSYDGRYWESSNSGLLRGSFTTAIQSNADIVTLTTWNDYTESWTSPSQERGYAVTDVAAYYIEWFKSGKAPAITQDALYYFHRSQRTDAPFTTFPVGRSGQKVTMYVPNGDPASNNVELVAFLTAPGTLTITQGTAVTTVDGGAGIVVAKAAMVPGTTPVFALRRVGTQVRSVTSKTPISAQVRFQDLIYHAGGGNVCARP